METVSLYFAWAWMLAGMVSGAVLGLFFHQHDWLGGYGSWRRRMVRLGHISFFGIGLVNLAFALTVRVLGIENGTAASSWLMIVAAATMPLVCYLSAARVFFRNLFFIPALSLTVGIGLFVWRILQL